MFVVFIQLLIIVLASYVIMKACHSYDIAAEYLGKNMPSGVKGATINAVGSSLPELMTTVFFLFLFHDLDGFATGVATCAGSAVFNTIVIPVLCVGAVILFGVKQKSGERQKLSFITVSRKTLIRDGWFLLVTLLFLVYILTYQELTWFMGLAMAFLYMLYLGVLLYDVLLHRKNSEHVAHLDQGHEAIIHKRNGLEWCKHLLDLDFNAILFRNQPLNNLRSWLILACSIIVIGIACYFLAEGVYVISEALEVKPYFTAVILAAAATSVPDAILSVKDSLDGDFDDAVANAFGSNIFNITIGLGLPLFLYAIFFEPVVLTAVEGKGSSEILELQIMITVITLLAFSVFLFGKSMGKGKVMLLLGIYCLWIIYIIGSAFEIHWFSGILSWL